MFSQQSIITKGLIVLYLFSVGYIIVTQRTFYGDGANYFLTLLKEKNFIFEYDFPRHYAHYFTQFPLVILIRIFNVKDLEILSYAFSLGLYFPQFISLWLCYSITKTKNIYFMLFPIISIFGIYMNVSFMSVHESHVIANIFWPILFYLVLKDEFTWRDSIALLVLGVVFTRSYESAAIWGLILLAVLVLKMRERWRNTSLHTKVVRLILSALFIVSIIIAAYSIIFPLNPANRDSFLSSFPAIFVHLPAMLSFVYIVILSLCIFFPDFPKSVLFKFIFALLVIATTFISLTPLIMPELTKPYLQYPARVHMTYMLPLISLVAFFVLRGTIVISEFTWKKIAVVIAFLVIGQTTWHILATKQWDGFCRVFRNELVKNNGVVPFEDTILINNRIGNQLIGVMAWCWENPTLSILLAKDQDVKTIILNPSSNTWQPFDPLNKNDLPKVEEFGFSFEKYKNHLPKAEMQ